MVKDGLTGIAAFGAMLIAFRGLQTWKRQLHGNANYELARRLLRAVYKLREALRQVRNPFIFPGEVLAARKAAGIDAAQPSRQDENRFTYGARWQRVVDARIDLDAELLEAEALWELDVPVVANGLFRCQVELLLAVEQLLSPSEPPQEPAVTIKNRHIVYGTGDTSDEYSAQLSAAIKELEGVIRPHLKL